MPAMNSPRATGSKRPARHGGIVATALKVFANKRGWVYDTTPPARSLVEFLGERVSEAGIIAHFDVAYGLHTNFYRDELTKRQLDVVPRDVVYRREVGVAPPMPPCGRR